MRPVISVLITLLTATAAVAQQQLQPISTNLEQGNVKRIVFLGDSITYDGRYVSDFESWLHRKYPNQSIEVINVGLPSETVSGLTEEGHADGKFPRPYLLDRLPSILEKTKPDLIFACYGMNCGIYKPFDEDRFAKYRDGTAKLHAAAVNSGARIVHITQPIYDAANAIGHITEYNGVLGKYSEWLLSMCDNGWDVIDLHGPMTAEVAKRRTTEPTFVFAPDGVHPDEAGHWFMAQQLIAYCGDAKSASAPSIDAYLDTKASALPLVRDRLVLMRDAWLTWTGHTHPALPAGLPMDEAKKKEKVLEQQIADALCDC